MIKYNISEKFISINGEGTHAGQLAAFLRFTGCNLNCSYCDTQWANVPNAQFTEMTLAEIINWIDSTDIDNITITGGEPLIQDNIYELLFNICQNNVYVEIETNGSANIFPFMSIPNRPSFTMDYKLASSGMELQMNTDNFSYLDKRDTLKFVVGSINDLDHAKEIINKYNLIKLTNVYISPVFGIINPSDIVDYMIKNKMNGINLQLQMHKFIWSPDKRGV